MNHRDLLPSSTVIFTEKVNPRRKGLKALRQDADERALVEAAQRDPRRFAELYELHFHQVYAYVVRRVQTREEAEDVTSDVFHRALAKIKDFEWRGVPFSAWLIRIAANAMADRWKRTQREGIQPMPDDVEDMNAHRKDMEERAALFQLVENLPADQRRVVQLRFVEQKSIREIAQEIRRTDGAVKQLQFRALQKLRAQMEGADA
jgi:RNA polymerase sigma-70 factor (ECF subfamily)